MWGSEKLRRMGCGIATKERRSVMREWARPEARRLSRASPTGTAALHGPERPFPQTWHDTRGSEADTSPLARGCAEVAFSALHLAQASPVQVLYLRRCLASDPLGLLCSPLRPASRGKELPSGPMRGSHLPLFLSSSSPLLHLLLFVISACRPPCWR